MWDLWPCNRLLLEPSTWNTVPAIWGGEKGLMCNSTCSAGQRRITDSRSGSVRAWAGGQSRHVQIVSFVPCKIRITTFSLHPKVLLKTQNREAARSYGDLVHLRCIHWCVRCTGYGKWSTQTTSVSLNPLFMKTIQYLTMQESWVWCYKQKYCGRWRDGAWLSGLGCAVLASWLLSMKPILSFWSSLPWLPDLADILINSSTISNFSFPWSQIQVAAANSRLLLKFN